MIGDGRHEAADVLLDGLILFDDYEWGDPDGRRHLPPNPGIDAVLELVGHELKMLQHGYQIAVRKRSC